MPNITLKIDDEALIRQVKILAAEQQTSVSALVKHFLTDLVCRNQAYNSAQKRAFEAMGVGLELGDGPLPRDEIYRDQL